MTIQLHVITINVLIVLYLYVRGITWNVVIEHERLAKHVHLNGERLSGSRAYWIAHTSIDMHGSLCRVRRPAKSRFNIDVFARSRQTMKRLYRLHELPVDFELATGPQLSWQE